MTPLEQLLEACGEAGWSVQFLRNHGEGPAWVASVWDMDNGPHPFPVKVKRGATQLEALCVVCGYHSTLARVAEGLGYPFVDDGPMPESHGARRGT